MKRLVMWAAIAPMMATAIAGCTLGSDSDEVEPVICPVDTDSVLSNEDNELRYITLTRSEQELVNENNSFAFNLFRAASNDKSMIISPISITYSLGMLNNGAAGETQKEINKVLGFGEAGADGINTFCQKMLTEAPTLDKLTKVMIANTVYMNKGYELKEDFISKAKTYYDAEPETRDFADGKTRDVINQWGSDHTEKMIKEVLKKDEFNPAAVSYLLNAIYFKGAWAEKFDKSNTKDEEFKTYSKQAYPVVPMMHQEHEFNYTETETCQVLCLPYGNNAYRMTILLPKEGKTTSDVLKGLTTDSWQQLQWMGNAIVDVKLPRFESDTDVDLKVIMSALGMPRAFDPSLAEFPNFCNTPTYIGMMKQVAKIKLNEEGTEAAAITVIGMKNSASSSEPQHVKFFANRPFLYVISEQSTGAIFFIGQFMGD